MPSDSTRHFLGKPFRVAWYTGRRMKRKVKRVMRRAFRRWLVRPRPPKFDELAWIQPIRIGFYVGANLNLIDGSSIWTQSTAEVLHADPRTGVVIPLRAVDRRHVITGALRRLERVALLDSTWFRRGRTLTHAEAVRSLAWMEARRPFHIVLLRGYELCLEAIQNGSFSGQLWSAYILEPERDINDPVYVAGMDAIARASHRVIVQTE